MNIYYQGLSSWAESVKLWKNALSCLPPVEQSTEAEQKSRALYTEGLRTAELQNSKMISPPSLTSHNIGTIGDMPWVRAFAKLRNETITEDSISSVCILRSYVFGKVVLRA